MQLNPIVAINAVPSETPGSSVVGTRYTLNTLTVTLDAAFNNWMFNLRDPLANESITVENLTPEVCSIAKWPLVERVTSGLARVRLAYREIRATRTLDMRTLTGGLVTYSITGFQSATLGDYTMDILTPLLAEGGDLNLLSGGVETGGNWDFGAAAYNPACWASMFNFTGVAHRNSHWNTPHFAGTAITDRHVLMVSHYLPPVGTVLTFIAADGAKVTRTILGYNSGNTFNGRINTNPVVGDLAVAVLSSGNLSAAGIAVYPVVGPWLLPNATVTTTNDAVVAGWVGLKLNQDRQVLLAGDVDTVPVLKSPQTAIYEGSTLTVANSSVGTDFGPNMNDVAFLAGYSAFYSQSIVGDSGTPRFFPKADGSLILVGCVTGSNGGASFPSANVLNALIASADASAGISTGLTVTVAPDPTL
jgi:hypothetical protein